MKLPKMYTLYKLMVFLLLLFVLFGILFDTNYN
jgi:hypothetical protein